ncbi:hypothetical protein [Actinomycetospora soli]|uniref:hypothetical protein n=1 Tax=Actinomycetospora soli TaxID=2893887 RepID=UPI001E5C7823|nr:hypothetical protein [Actinomycetospora soli]MCD2189573.1 hypothetical protein [Actinomycetospora soli]
MAVGLDVGSTGFTVRLSGIDVLAGGRRELVVPFARVLGARVMRRADALASGPRLAAPALGWPRRWRTGCWGIGERRQFWAVHGGTDLVVVYLSGRPFHRVVVDVAEPHLTHRRLDTALLSSKKHGPRCSLRRRQSSSDQLGARWPSP